MKLVLIADTFPPMRTSAAVQLRDLTRAFVQQGHALTVLLPAPEIDTPWALERFDGAQILRLQSPVTKDVGYLRRTLGEWRMPHSMRHNLAKSPLSSESWDGVIWYSPSIFHGPLVRAVKRQSDCKAYLILRDIFPEWAVDLGLMRPGLAYRFFKRVARQQYEVADIIGVQSAGNLGYFESWRSDSARHQSLEVLQNWLGTPGQVPCRIRVQDSKLAGRKIFVYAGNMGVAQGMDILLDLAHSLLARRDIGFLFVGRGRDAARLQGSAIARGLDNIMFHDEIDPDEIPGLYAQCHAGIVALDQRHKSHNIPGKFLSYMQSRLPVLAVVNRGNDLADLIRRERVGAVCETHSLEELQHYCLAMVAQMTDDLALFDRCEALFDRRFSVDETVHQIVAALCCKIDHLAGAALADALPMPSGQSVRAGSSAGG